MPNDDKVEYEIVEHDGGWAYKLGETFSETFPSREEAFAAALRVAAEQERPGEAEIIEFEDEKGQWREELAEGDDRPMTFVLDRFGKRMRPATPAPGQDAAAGLLGDVIRASPLAAVLIAAAVGFLAARL